MKDLKSYVHDSLNESRNDLSIDGVKKILEDNGYTPDDLFRIVGETDNMKTYAFRNWKGTKVYNTVEAKTSRGISKFLSAYDGDEKELSVEFDKNGKFVFGSVYKHKGGKAGTGTTTEQLRFGFSEDELQEILDEFFG